MLELSYELSNQEQTDIKCGIKDSYVKIIEENIRPGKENQFVIQSGSYTFDVPYDGGSVMHYGNKNFGIEECQTIQVTLSGGALEAQESREGVYYSLYEKSAKVNGKLSWTYGSHALWLASNGVWIVGYKTDIGKPIGILYNSVSGLPYGNTNDWHYWNGNLKKWVNPIDEIRVECTNLETKTTIEPLVCNNRIS